MVIDILLTYGSVKEGNPVYGCFFSFNFFLSLTYYLNKNANFSRQLPLAWKNLMVNNIQPRNNPKYL
ncbi:hypothetical protein A4R26_15575 [Niastella populi]|uniref:Uncharacterized protein n=1 Tax=Niastella populi TaxID=550983 RepID=A0A1V9G3G3_9BACT|nr:hypothetical protein A4R26_15575 [Niastella populi]